MLLSFILCFTLVKAQKIDGVAIVVGDEILTNIGLQQQMRVSAAKNITNKENCELINNIMLQMLLIHKAKQDTLITIDNNQIEARAKTQMESFRQRASDEQLMNVFGVNSIYDLKKELEIQLKDQMYGQRMQSKLTQQIDANPVEVKRFFIENEMDLPRVKEKIQLSHIVFEPLINQKSRDKIIERLRVIKKDVLEGADFSKKAFIYSEDPGSSANGGLYEKIKRGKFVKEFEAVAFTLKEGEVSDPFLTQFGYHIIKLEKRRGEEIDLRHILIKLKPTEKEMRQTVVFADSIKSKITQGSLSFEEAAKIYSIDKYTKNNGGITTSPKTGSIKQDLDDLPVNLSFALTGVKENELSDSFEDVFEQNKVVRIIRLDKLIPSHEMSYEDDYEKLKLYTLNQKKEEHITNWANDAIRFTFIKLDEEFNSCNFKINWQNQ